MANPGRIAPRPGAGCGCHASVATIEYPCATGWCARGASGPIPPVSRRSLKPTAASVFAAICVPSGGNASSQSGEVATPAAAGFDSSCAAGAMCQVRRSDVGRLDLRRRLNSISRATAMHALRGRTLKSRLRSPGLQSRSSVRGN
jgi:hypothetical protein